MTHKHTLGRTPLGQGIGPSQGHNSVFTNTILKFRYFEYPYLILIYRVIQNTVGTDIERIVSNGEIFVTPSTVVVLILLVSRRERT